MSKQVIGYFHRETRVTQQMRVEYFDGFAETSAEGNQKFESKI